VLATRGVRVARETGAFHVLPNALNYLAALNVHSGAFAAAARQIDEVDAITRATGTPPLKHAAVMLTALRGDYAQLQEVTEVPVRGAMARGEGSAFGAVGWFTAFLHNSHGRYGEALATANAYLERPVGAGRPRAFAQALQRNSRLLRLAAADSGLDQLDVCPWISGTTSSGLPRRHWQARARRRRPLGR
jgi:hypothetical protein